MTEFPAAQNNRSPVNSKSCLFLFLSFNRIYICSPAADHAFSKCQVMQLTSYLKLTWDYYMVPQNTYIHIYIWELLQSHCSAVPHCPDKALPWSLILDTYSISKDWLSRFLGIKMQKQVCTHEMFIALQPRRNYSARDSLSLLQEAGL